MIDVKDVVDVGSDHCIRSITYVKRCIVLSVINIAITCNCARYVEPCGKRLAERKFLSFSINRGNFFACVILSIYGKCDDNFLNTGEFL
ncbi:unnamed protein product [Rotaria magnacalcarata]|uniref:Uncharacterized protein n=2 Tax=Rotaria magnacalcarata TaxID=392030 RepID=A0A819EZC7_9BILA|nr:unnamed protein product [Rotaria magnacalcarata]